MKILLVHNFYRSRNIGGEDIVYRNELEMLQKKLGEDNVFEYEISTDDFKLRNLFVDLWFSFKHYFSIKKVINENNIDLMHVHNFFPMLSPSVFVAGKRAGAKVVHTLHNYRFWCIAGTLFQKGKGVCELCILKRSNIYGVINKCYRNSLIQSAVVTLSFQFYRFLNFFNFIDYFFVLTDFQKNKVRSYGLSEKKILIKPNFLMDVKSVINKDKADYLYVGRLEDSKGIVDLLAVWEELPEKFKIKVVGKGELEQKLKKKYKEFKNIEFLGQCSRGNTMALISKAKYLIQSSLLYETFGLTIIEAFSQGTPVLAYNIGTRKDLVSNEYNGLLCESGEMKNLLLKSFIYPDYEQLAKNSLKTADNFLAEKVINDQITLYKKILLNG